MKTMIAASAAAMTPAKTAFLYGMLVALAPGAVLGQSIEKKGTTPYVTHFIFRPLMNIDIPGVGTATALEAVGTTENMKGEAMLDKMSAHCTAVSVASGEKNFIDGACVLADKDGDKIFRRSIRAISTSRSRKWIAAPTSSLGVPASMWALPGASLLRV